MTDQSRNIATGNGAPVSDPNWKAKEVWTLRRGDKFTIEVVHQYREPMPESLALLGERDGGHRWNVYAYIYNKHPHFHQFDGVSMFQQAAADLHLHSGPSLFAYHYYASGEIASVQVGCDYQHWNDEQYTFMADAESAASIFADARRLFDQLVGMEI